MGKGLSSEDNQKWIKKINNNNEDLNDVVNKVLNDKLSFGNGWIEIITNKERSFVHLFHKDATECRLSKDRKKVILHPDYKNYENNKELKKEIPLFPKFKFIKGYYRSCFHWKDYEPTYKIYGIPDWISGLEAAGIIYKTNKWNISRLENSFNPSGVLIIQGDMEPEDAKELKDKIDTEFIGEGRQGKILSIVKEPGDEKSTEWTPLNQENDGNWIKLHSQSNEDLISAHSWFPTLSGIVLPGKLGAINQIRTEYQIAVNTVIREEQQRIIRMIKTIFRVTIGNEFDDLIMTNESPVNLLDLLELNKLVKIWEGRQMAGLEYDEDDESQKQYIDNGNPINNSGESNWIGDN